MTRKLKASQAGPEVRRLFAAPVPGDEDPEGRALVPGPDAVNPFFPASYPQDLEQRLGLALIEATQKYYPSMPPRRFAGPEVTEILAKAARDIFEVLQGNVELMKDLPPSYTGDLPAFSR